MWKTRKYDLLEAYAQSKLANVMHATELSKRFNGVFAASVHPGWMMTQLQDYMMGKGCFRKFVSCMYASDLISPEDGAQTSLHCALAELSDLESGAFYSQHGVYNDKESQAGGWPMKFPNDNNTPEASARLWDESVKLTGATWA